jgi:hypothetical protein
MEVQLLKIFEGIQTIQINPLKFASKSLFTSGGIGQLYCYKTILLYLKLPTIVANNTHIII